VSLVTPADLPYVLQHITDLLHPAERGVRMPGLSVRGVGVRFGGLTALDDVSFEVPPASVVGVIGPNGAGKTTLFNVVSGFVRPTSGSLLWDDARFRPVPHRLVSLGIARTLQGVGLFAGLTVLENVMVGAIYGKRRPAGALDRALEVIEFVGIADRASDLPAGLTLAGRKRLELARALATEPRVLLLDEVIAGVNPAEAQQMAELIRSVRKSRGLSIIMIEHVMPAVMALSDRVIVLDAGKKISEGKPQEVVRDPKVIAAYLGESAVKAPAPAPAEKPS
jgi:branched-chain amino acid transport system ATP-binding protein